MAYKYTDAIFEFDGVQGVAKSVLLVLGYYANEKTGACWPSIATICRRSGWSRTAVKNGLAELLDKEIVRILGTKPSKNGSVNLFQINQVVFEPGREKTQSGEDPVGIERDPVVSRPSTGSSRGGDQGARRPQNLLLNKEEEQAIDQAIAQTRQQASPETRETLDPKDQKQPLIWQIDDEDEPLPPVHSPAPQAIVIPPAAAPRKVVVVPPPAIVKETPKPDPADYDMDDRFGRSEYKRALMDWQDNQRATGASA